MDQPAVLLNEILKKIVDNQRLTDAEVIQLEWLRKDLVEPMIEASDVG